MTKEELNIKIDKKKAEIAKIQKRIDKWTQGMNEEAKAIVAACELLYNDPKLPEARKREEQYAKEHDNDSTVFNQSDWNKGPQLGEAYRAYRDLAEAKGTLNKYLVQLDKLTNFEKEEKIPAIWDFLMNWRKQAYDYYLNQVRIFTELKDNYQEAWEKYKNSVDYEDAFNALGNYRWKESELESRFRRKYYQDIDSLTRDITLRHGKVDEEKLNKHLDEEVRNKYTRLVNDVTEKAGEIVDASALRVNARGEINGRIKGTKNDVDLWLTLSAIDSDYMVPHYRGYCRVAK